MSAEEKQSQPSDPGKPPAPDQLKPATADPKAGKDPKAPKDAQAAPDAAAKADPGVGPDPSSAPDPRLSDIVVRRVKGSH